MMGDDAPMTSWHDLTTDAPELAADVQARFDATGLAFLATLRKDGSPRISGIEPLFTHGELWLGMMPGSLKAADLRRDPRFALHAASVDKEVKEGDAKVAGRAVEVTDEAEQATFLGWFEEANGYAPPPPFHLYRAEVTEVVLVRPAEDHLVITTWHEGRGIQRIERA